MVPKSAGQQYERPFLEVIGIQHEIVAAISGHIISSSFHLEAPKHNRTENAESYRLYLIGRYLLRKRTVDDVYKAIDYFRKSVFRSPNNIHSHVEIVNSYHFLHILDRLSRSDTLAKIRPSLDILAELNLQLMSFS